MTQEDQQRPFTAASFYHYLGEKTLMGARCGRCKALFLPPRAICCQCHGDQMTWLSLSGRGRLAAFTAVHVGPTFMNEQGFNRHNPYLTGIVELEEGVRVSARLLGFEGKQPSEVRIGTRMVVEFIRIGEGEEAKTQLAFRAE